MPALPDNFPLSEGLGIFIGISAWEILVEGYTDPIRGLSISIACTFVWYGARLWRKRNGRN